jgi:putative heme-binding domain-containing protein
MSAKLSLISIACLGTVLTAHAQSLPQGKGVADFQRTCSVCHSLSLATSLRLTHDGWAGVVDDMVSRGAEGTPEQLGNIVNYLSTNFGKGNASASNAAPAPVVKEQAAAPAPVVKEQAAAPAPVVKEKEAPLSEEEISKANELIQGNGCLSCHRVGGMGSYIGPDLSDVGVNRSPEQIRAALVSPNKEVLPENRTVRLVTSDGETVTGRLLNQDGFSVQIISSSGQPRSFEKSGLREFTIVVTNPMPSYAGKMNAEDLTVLAHYLSSLKGVDHQ